MWLLEQSFITSRANISLLELQSCFYHVWFQSQHRTDLQKILLETCIRNDDKGSDWTDNGTLRARACHFARTSQASHTHHRTWGNLRVSTPAAQPLSQVSEEYVHTCFTYTRAHTLLTPRHVTSQRPSLHWGDAVSRSTDPAQPLLPHAQSHISCFLNPLWQPFFKTTRVAWYVFAESRR